MFGIPLFCMVNVLILQEGLSYTLGHDTEEYLPFDTEQ